MSLSRQVACRGYAEASAHPADRSEETTGPPAAAETGAAPLRSVHTANFPALLDQLGISLLVTTYQAGKLVVVRSEGERLNTHFRRFASPMGLAVAGDRLALGTSLQIWEFHNIPAAAAKLEPAGRHDACFLPRSCHVTGDVQIHEMAWADEELWFVNTRFSCLCTRNVIHSFVPRWRPPFITALTPEDRCHLNGLGVRDGRPRYVTALAQSDQPAGGPTRRTAAFSHGRDDQRGPAERPVDAALAALVCRAALGAGIERGRRRLRRSALRPLRGPRRAARLHPRTRL
jgi:hypothetical protein